MSQPRKEWITTSDGLTRARGSGLQFDGSHGPNNAITDVPGVCVGYATVIQGEGTHRYREGPVRTGVTVILPHGAAGVRRACAGGVYSSNGNGEMTGSHWIEESGTFATPIGITNTHAQAVARFVANGALLAVNSVDPRHFWERCMQHCRKSRRPEGHASSLDGGVVVHRERVAGLSSFDKEGTGLRIQKPRIAYCTHEIVYRTHVAGESIQRTGGQNGALLEGGSRFDTTERVDQSTRITLVVHCVGNLRWSLVL